MKKKWQILVLGIMCMALTMGICIQIKTINNKKSLSSSDDDLNELRSQVLKTKEEYEKMYSKLEKKQNELDEKRENITKNNEELQSIENQIKEANEILGLTDVKGNGAEITISNVILKNTLYESKAYNESSVTVNSKDILEIINELKNAGAEAIEINGQRIIYSTVINSDGNSVIINGEKINSPYKIKAIAKQDNLVTLNRPGGYIYYCKNEGLSVSYSEIKDGNVKINKYTGIINFKYAQTVK